MSAQFEAAAIQKLNTYFDQVTAFSAKYQKLIMTRGYMVPMPQAINLLKEMQLGAEMYGKAAQRLEADASGIQMSVQGIKNIMENIHLILSAQDKASTTQFDMWIHTRMGQVKGQLVVLDRLLYDLRHRMGIRSAMAHSAA